MFHIAGRAESIEIFIESLNQREYPCLLSTDIYSKERVLEAIRNRSPLYRDFVRRNLAKYISRSFEIVDYESLHSLELVLILEEVSGLKISTTAIFKEDKNYQIRMRQPLIKSLPSPHYPHLLRLFFSI